MKTRKWLFPSLSISLERWKFSTKYNVYVSNKGRVKDAHKRIIEPRVNESGYFEAYISYCYPAVLLHRLVAETWLPNAEMSKLTVDHLDSNKRNCAVNNLEWVTREENTRRARAKEIRPQNKTDAIGTTITLDVDSFLSTVWEQNPGCRYGHLNIGDFNEAMKKKLARRPEKILGFKIVKPEEEQKI